MVEFIFAHVLDTILLMLVATLCIVKIVEAIGRALAAWSEAIGRAITTEDPTNAD